MKIKTFDISGFGGGYESTCQKMIWQAVKYLVENKPKDLTSKQSKSITGVCINEGKDGEAFDEAMMNGIDGATGAMHQYATNHARFIYEKGYDKWFEKMAKHRDKSFEYDFVGEIDLTLTGVKGA